jgi:hypothetical protein
MSLALLVFVQHNVLLATSFKKLKGEWRKNSYIALTFMGSLLVGTCTVRTVDSWATRSEGFLMGSKKKKSEYARSWRY